MPDNTLYYGDNLDILRKYFANESVDLIYLDPPFNSNRSYNLLFKESSGFSANAQITAFDDTWHWGPSAEQALLEVETGPRQDVAAVLRALVDALGRRNDMTAYLAMMTVRLLELHRVLKPTGSIYLHCDPTASSYLRVVMDAIFGPAQFKNEITWRRTTAHNDPKRFGRIQDRVLFYSKSADKTFNHLPGSYSPEQLSRYKYQDDNGPYRAENLTAPHHSPTRSLPWRGITPGANRQWRFSLDELERLYGEGRILTQKDGRPRKDGYKMYLTDGAGPALQDLWTDIALPPTSGERLGYPTQKPLALLERIISASSNPGDVVLDPFCGCGTAVCAAQKLGRQWAGIDITHLAVALIRSRLTAMFGSEVQYREVGAPQDLASANALALRDRYQFQAWALSRIPAFPAQSKKGADAGLDGHVTFVDSVGKPKLVVVQVKSGHVDVRVVRELSSVVASRNAVMGFLVTLEEPTNPMQLEAVAAGFYHSDWWNRDYQKLQILMVEELLHGTTFDMPPTNVTFDQATRVRQGGEQGRLL